jgi:hypothetical protein
LLAPFKALIDLVFFASGIEYSRSLVYTLRNRNSIADSFPEGWEVPGVRVTWGWVALGFIGAAGEFVATLLVWINFSMGLALGIVFLILLLPPRIRHIVKALRASKELPKY